ncbi:hypothetical protein GIW05_00960 [Pseudomonas syringae]|uniref:ParB/RepB/Spo0J family partition protein n=1 Tax=Pseudomonas syringae TaxID=317 RepID=UPI001F3DA3F6|nr:ParB/RepB/Spo0J family partition protein [Pseudomonas syringae]MCF5382092.1 hypothetical protein [Pseudomonas syringae]MCF5454454.1 hypothetical protein [Pseudomonas syringae]MCF5460129.1 hypothetical protein [Pseudomonas syringae]
MKRDLSKLGGVSAAAVNAGTIGIQKDKVLHVDPETEILYDPAENVRNGKVVDDSKPGLIDLRRTIDDSGQHQLIRLYPLPPSKLDPKKPALKYGIAFGHRRVLCCRLTKKDHPDFSELPRKVSAVLDVDWLKKGKSYRLRCQIEENTQRVDLNFVEFGQAIHDYREALESEEGRSVPQRELQVTYNLKEKTLGNLLQAASFHELTKAACNGKVMTDLDALVTFDSICKINLGFAQAIYNSLLDESAPRTRSMIRQAKAKIEADPEFVVNPETWVWPDIVAAPVSKPPQKTAPVPTPASPASPPTITHRTGEEAGGAGSSSDSTNGAEHNLGNELPANAALSGESSGGKQSPAPQPAVTVPPANVAGQSATSEQGAGKDSTRKEVVGTDPASSTIIMVSFKMGEEAKQTFSGELLLNRKAKLPSLGVVAYLDDGREQTVEVPLKLIKLVSIS